MSVYGEDRVLYEGSCEDREEIVGNISSSVDKDGEPPTPTMEAEKRIRREIANSNERRRMQSINNGFQSLRSLLPHHEGEKLSKAAILQQTAEYIYSLEQEKTRLLSQNCHLKRLVDQYEGGEMPAKKRKTELLLPTTSESSDEGLGSMSPEPVIVTVSNQPDSVTELRRQLERERNAKLLLEEQKRQLESQLYQQQPIYDEPEEISLQLVAADSVPPVGHTQTVMSSPVISRSPSPIPVAVVVVGTPEQRLPSVLEAAIKAEPKVEVERLPSPNTPSEEARLYVSNTSRQNLETIVEAIRHLEGDHMFGDEPQPQDAPLALTTRPPPALVPAPLLTTDHIKVEVHPYIEFHHTTSSIQQQQQSRPGVIVGKQSS